MSEHFVMTRIVKEVGQSDREGVSGSEVQFENGYVSWLPSEVLVKFGLLVQPGLTDNSQRITPIVVEDFIAKYEDFKGGQKTTIVVATLKNGFEVVGTSACVDPLDYVHEIGIANAKKRIIEKVWELLGFLLQTARDGVGS